MSMRGRTSAWLPFLIFGLIACMQTRDGTEGLTGTSVGTGNPGKVKVSFKNQGASFEFSGLIEVYGATQIPIAGFRPKPIAVFPVEKESVFTISAFYLASIPDTTWPRGSVEGDSLFRIKLVINGNGFGAIAGPLVLEKKEIRTDANILPLKVRRLFIEPKLLIPEKHHYLFLYGTGYAAKSDSGKFAFPPMPEEAFEPAYISLPNESTPLTRKDSVLVYKTALVGSRDSMDVISITTIHEIIPLPELYKQQ